MASWSPQYLQEHLATGGLIFVRVAALMMIAPMLGPFELATRWRLAVALAIAVLLAPLAVGRLASPPATLGTWLVVAGGEALVGLMLGLGVRIMFTGLQVAGGLISQMSGLQMSEMFNPALGGNVPVFSQFLLLVATAVFLLIGGHRQLMEALLDSFTGVPMGHATFSASAVRGVTTLVANAFALGLRTAVPAVVSLLLATLIVGFIGRTLPQLNVLSLGFGINVMTALVAFCVSLGGACWLFQDSLGVTIQTALQALHTP
jgi:flagellar biosynthetic protein FliR